MKNLLCLFVLVTSISFGQNSSFGMSWISYTPDEIKINIDGTPYLSTNFKGGFTTIQGNFGFNAPMRYNAGKNVIEFLDSDQINREVLRRPYIMVNIDGKSFEIIKYIDKEAEKMGYFNPLSEGKTRLLFMPRKELFIKGGFHYETDAAYRDISSYYVKKEGRPAQKIKLNRKSIIIHLFDKVVEMNTFITDYGLNLRKEEDVVRLFDYYNSLSIQKPSKKEMQS